MKREISMQIKKKLRVYFLHLIFLKILKLLIAIFLFIYIFLLTKNKKKFKKLKSVFFVFLLTCFITLAHKCQIYKLFFFFFFYRI